MLLTFQSRRTPSVSRTPSRTRPGSRASSISRQNQNSSSDLKINRAASTSDIGSEIGDSENQDPNFR